MGVGDAIHLRIARLDLGDLRRQDLDRRELFRREERPGLGGREVDQVRRRNRSGNAVGCGSSVTPNDTRYAERSQQSAATEILERGAARATMREGTDAWQAVIGEHGDSLPPAVAAEIRNEQVAKRRDLAAGYSRPGDRTSVGATMPHSAGVRPSMRWLSGEGATLHPPSIETAPVP